MVHKNNNNIIKKLKLFSRFSEVFTKAREAYMLLNNLRMWPKSSKISLLQGIFVSKNGIFR